MQLNKNTVFIIEGASGIGLAFDEEIDINLRAVVHLTKLSLPLLKKAPEAAIINVSSLAEKIAKKR